MTESTRIFRATSMLAAVGVGFFLAMMADAEPHDAPTGWKYPYSCCSGIDCRPISQSSIAERSDGIHIAQNGEVLAYSDTRIRESKDDQFHLCTVAGEEHSRTICLFVPPRGF